VNHQYAYPGHNQEKQGKFGFFPIKINKNRIPGPLFVYQSEQFKNKQQKRDIQGSNEPRIANEYQWYENIVRQNVVKQITGKKNKYFKNQNDTESQFVIPFRRKRLSSAPHDVGAEQYLSEY
jgi:hypothetical protein